MFSTRVEANWVGKAADAFAAYKLTDDDREAIVRLSKQPDIGECRGRGGGGGREGCGCMCGWVAGCEWVGGCGCLGLGGEGGGVRQRSMHTLCA